MVKCSIIIPNYNGMKFLDKCLSSLNMQTNISFEIIVVDNASTDQSAYFIRTNYPLVKMKILDNNYGFSRAVNEGISLSSGEYIVLLNNDTEVESNWLAALYSSINKSSCIFSVSSKMIRYYDRHLIDDAGDNYTLLGWAYKRGDGKNKKNFIKEETIFSSCAGAAIYRKTILKEIGYFDESFFAYLEDVDISYRAQLFGYKNIYCPEAIVYHIGSGTSGSKYNTFKIKLAARNSAYLIYKNMPFIQILINIPFLFIGFLIKLLFFTKKGWGKVYLEGTIEAFRSIKKIQRQRFSIRNFAYYVRIQWLLLKSTINYFCSFISEAQNKLLREFIC